MKLVVLSEKSTVSDHRSNVPMRKQSQELFWPCVAGVKKGRGEEGEKWERAIPLLLSPVSRPVTHALQNSLSSVGIRIYR